MPIVIKELLAELKSGFSVIYGPRLKGVYVFGSYARGNPESESDVDVLVVLTELETYGKEVKATSCLVSKLSLQHGVSISRVFVSEKDWNAKKTPFLVNIQPEAISA